jgi:hypothetical protein
VSEAHRRLADAARRIAGPRPLLKPSGAPAAQGGRALVQGVLGRFGYRLDRVLPYYLDAERVRLVEAVAPYTMTSIDRINATIDAAEYVARNDIPGALVECGVWRGGSAMAMALALVRMGRSDHDLYLFDTFEGMPQPMSRDVTASGASAASYWSAGRDGAASQSSWLSASVDDVRAAVLGTGYEPARVHFVKGKVEDTLPESAPERIALLRLDTDLYSSTRHELDHLFPRLVDGGILILDDYDDWVGARDAADEYIRERGVRIFLSRIAGTGRIAVKQPAPRAAG